MSKSLDESLANKTKIFIKDAIEPKILKIIEKANQVLEKHGVVIGAEIQWFLDKTEKEKNNEK